ncbi:DUF5103 domain-containing protein [soil metagenome]
MHLIRLSTTLLACAILVLSAGCAGLEDANGERPEGPPRSRTSLDGPSLAQDADSVRTVQLYRLPDESALPIIRLGGGEQLQLAFDILGTSVPRRFEVRFYHTDRDGRRGLLPVEYMGAFSTDNLTDVRASSGPAVRYDHYRYAFPNQAIQFTFSGSYVLRVHEAGYEDRVLFERPFFVSEEAAQAEFAVQSALVGGGRVARPVLQLRPGQQLGDQIFNFQVCFVRNGRFDAPRCVESPTLFDALAYQFYLPEDLGFEPLGPVYEVDLGVLQPINRIAAVDYTVMPYRALIDLDYARFGGLTTFFGDELGSALAGQPIVHSAVIDVPDPNTQGEYVRATFRYVPQDNVPHRGSVYLSGSFNAWRTLPAFRMDWDGENNRYETTVLIKQGRYVYRYVTADRDERARRRITSGEPSLYTALVYYRDFQRSTDRLIAVRSVIAD